MAIAPCLCPRCGGDLKDGFMMSRFNTEECCMKCIAKEKEHPKYAEAFATEEAAVRSGNYNFPGIGKPAGL